MGPASTQNITTRYSIFFTAFTVPRSIQERELDWRLCERLSSACRAASGQRANAAAPQTFTLRSRHPRLKRQVPNEKYGRMCLYNPPRGGQLRLLRTRHHGSALAVAIAAVGFIWFTAGADTVAVFAQADVAHSTIKGRVMDPVGA